MLGELSSPPCLLTGFQGVLLLREGKGKKRKKGEEGKRREGEGCIMAFGGMDAPV